jgi:hypothetical protein
MYDRMSECASILNHTIEETASAQPEQKRRRATIMDPIMKPVDLAQTRRTGLVVLTLNRGPASS